MDNNNMQLERFANCTPQSLADAFTVAAISGDVDTVALFIALDTLSKAFELAKDNNDFMQALESEFMRNAHKNEYRAFGVAMSKTSIKTYRYDTCNDPYLVQLEAKIRETTAKAKDRKAYLRALCGESADELSGGEFVTPPMVESKSVFRVTRLKP